MDNDLSYRHPHRRGPNIRRTRSLGTFTVSQRSWSARAKKQSRTNLNKEAFSLKRTTEDQDELPIDFRLLDAMLRASSDPEEGIAPSRSESVLGLG